MPFQFGGNKGSLPPRPGKKEEPEEKGFPPKKEAPPAPGAPKAAPAPAPEPAPAPQGFSVEAIADRYGYPTEDIRMIVTDVLQALMDQVGGGGEEAAEQPVPGKFPEKEF